MNAPFHMLLNLQRSVLFKNQDRFYKLEIWSNTKNGRVRGTLYCSSCFYKAEDSEEQFPVFESWSSVDFELKEYSSDTELLEAVEAFLNPPVDPYDPFLNNTMGR